MKRNLYKPIIVSATPFGSKETLILNPRYISAYGTDGHGYAVIITCEGMRYYPAYGMEALKTIHEHIYESSFDEVSNVFDSDTEK